LTSPTGVTSTLMARPGFVIGAAADAQQFGPDVVNDFTPVNFVFTFETVADWGETPTGTWTVNVVDASGAASQAEVNGVKLQFDGVPLSYGTPAPQVHVYTDEFAALSSTVGNAFYDPNNAARSTLTNSSQNTKIDGGDTINVAATTGTVYLDLSGVTDSTIDGRALTVKADISTVYLGDGAATIKNAGSNNANGTDTYYAGRGAATIYGSARASNEFYAGGSIIGLPAGTAIGVDTFYGNSRVSAPSIFNDFYLGAGLTHVIGSGVNNYIWCSYLTSGVTINLATGVNGGAAAGDTFSDVQGIMGSNYNDTIGAWGGMTLDGGGGVNTLDYSAAPAAVVVDFIAETAQVGSLAIDLINNFQNVIGSGDVIKLASGMTSSIRGNNNSISMVSNSKTILNVTGNGDVVTSSSNTIILNGTGSSATVNGANTINLAASSETLALGASVSDIVNVAAGVSNETISGSSATISVGANGGINLTGNSDVVTAASGSSVVITGTSDTIIASNSTIIVNAGSAVTINGSNDTIVVNGSSTVTSGTGSSGDTFVFHANFGHDTIYGFNASDYVQIDKSLFPDWAHLQAAIKPAGTTDAIIAYDANNSIAFNHVLPAQLNSAEFRFV
jgi:hypothetical protein